MYFNAKNYGHQRSKKAFAKETITYARGIEHGEDYADCPEMVFKSPKDYVERKLAMLRRDMYIEPTIEEIMHLHELTTQWDIDRAVKSIIDHHWN